MEFGTPEEKRRFARWAFGSFALATGLWVLVATTGWFGPIGFVRAGEEAFANGFWTVEWGLWCLGCGAYARWRGYSWILGVAGALLCLGFVIVAALPDRWEAALRRRGRSRRRRNCRTTPGRRLATGRSDPS